MLDKLESLYGSRAPEVLERIEGLTAAHANNTAHRDSRLWDQRDVILITYGDQVSEPGHPPLATLHNWLVEQDLDGLTNTVHVLPFSPYSSDDGFSVMDYREVNAELGDWGDIERLHRDFNLMFDLVLNHCSRRGQWFSSYLAGEQPFCGFFIEVDPGADLSTVVRPRSLPLLTSVHSDRGPRQVWTTFSSDQVDLDFSNPDVLIEMLDIALDYLRRGARVLRLDAIAYLWKQIGTSCINLRQTHTIVKVIRELLESTYPGSLILTETNLPHAENLSYFGAGDEAHLVYQFSLPPLMLDAYLQEDGRVLAEWLQALQLDYPATSFLNFLASHDGVGLRPLEGLVSGRRREAVIAATRKRGALVSTRRDQHGHDQAYELNVSWFSALGDHGPDGTDRQVQRFLASHALLLALRGIPAIYFHSLIGTPNDLAGARERKMARAINRRKFELSELRRLLIQQDSWMGSVFERMKAMIRVRTTQPAFHPDASQRVCATDIPSVLAFERMCRDAGQCILVVVNFGSRPESVRVHETGLTLPAYDLLSATEYGSGDTIELAPLQVLWLAPNDTG